MLLEDQIMMLILKTLEVFIRTHVRTLELLKVCIRRLLRRVLWLGWMNPGIYIQFELLQDSAQQ